MIYQSNTKFGFHDNPLFQRWLDAILQFYHKYGIRPDFYDRRTLGRQQMVYVHDNIMTQVEKVKYILSYAYILSYLIYIYYPIHIYTILYILCYMILSYMILSYAYYPI